VVTGYWNTGILTTEKIKNRSLYKYSVIPSGSIFSHIFGNEYSDTPIGDNIQPHRWIQIF
jgi:hypothetical protein